MLLSQIVRPIILPPCTVYTSHTFTEVAKISLSSSWVFPSHFNPAHVNPLLKKPSLLANDLNSYRSISNLSFISKVSEKSLSSRLKVLPNCNHLSNVFRFAYKEFHATEIVLLKGHNDISLNINTEKVTTLILLDLSFKIVDYSVLQDRFSD